MKPNVLLLAFFFLVACKEISFKDTQPKNKKALKAVPSDLQGKYLPVKDDGDLSTDTIIVTARGYHFGFFDPADRSNTARDKFDEGALSDSLVLKYYRGYYFLNFNEHPEWLLRVVQRQPNGDLIFMAPEQENVDFNTYLKKLSAEIAVDSSEVSGEMLYQIDPRPSQLVNLIEKGFFSKVLLKKIE